VAELARNCPKESEKLENFKKVEDLSVSDLWRYAMKIVLVSTNLTTSITGRLWGFCVQIADFALVRCNGFEQDLPLKQHPKPNSCKENRYTFAGKID
jgi:hypothetical protein